MREKMRMGRMEMKTIASDERTRREDVGVREMVPSRNLRKRMMQVMMQGMEKLLRKEVGVDTRSQTGESLHSSLSLNARVDNERVMFSPSHRDRSRTPKARIIW